MRYFSSLSSAASSARLRSVTSSISPCMSSSPRSPWITVAASRTQSTEPSRATTRYSERSWSPGLLEQVLVLEHAAAVVRVDALDPRPRVGRPLLGGPAEHPLDLAAHERPVALLAEGGRVHDRRHLLDQGAHPLVARGQAALGSALRGRVARRGVEAAVLEGGGPVEQAGLARARGRARLEGHLGALRLPRARQRLVRRRPGPPRRRARASCARRARRPSSRAPAGARGSSRSGACPNPRPRAGRG